MAVINWSALWRAARTATALGCGLLAVACGGGSGGNTSDDDPPMPAVVGLDERPDNLSCTAPARPTADATVAVVDPYPALPNLIQPTKLLLEPGGDRWFVTQKSGQIVTLPRTAPTTVTPYLDLTLGRAIRTVSEGGLLSLAFHPDYPATPEIFVSYTIDNDNPPMRSVVSRLILDDVNTPGAGTIEQIILEVDQDFDNHNGGELAFGPDGYLYFGLGDGGSSNDPRQRSQDTTRLLGSMLRIDVVGTGAGYTLPPDNPFGFNAACGPADNSNDCPEIYAWGLRNPWRWSFDLPTGELWLADVGQGAREEVNRIRRGGNYGWRCREGTLPTGNAGDCAGSISLIDPLTEYDRTLGNSITGGYVYRGSAIPELAGLYVYADFGSGRFWAAQPDGQGGYDNDLLVDTDLRPTSFATGADGELYVVNIGGAGRGRIWQLVPAGSPVPDTIAEQLSSTGCVDPSDATQAYGGLVPYNLNAPFWSDGAAKDRYIAIPNGTRIDINAEGGFEFPVGTRIVKNFRVNGNLIETRHLLRHTDGVWAGYTYEWNGAQTEAARVRGGKVTNIGSQNWVFPSEGQCMECHTAAAGFTLGLEIAQLNRDLTYPATGRSANQLATLEDVGLLSDPLPAEPAALDVLADPDSAAPLADRARAYLHTNCAQCHRPNGPTPSLLDLRYSVPLADTNTCDVEPLLGNLAVPNARLIAPGAADRSVLVERMNRRDSSGMPPVGSTVIDSAGIATVSAWIDSLSDCS